MRAVLHTALALEQRLHEIADLHRCSDDRAEHERGASAQVETGEWFKHPMRVRPAREHAKHEGADRACPCLPRTHRGHQLRAPERAADKKSRRVRDPREYKW